MARDVDYSFKLLVLGDTCVGKTCFIKRYVDQKYVGPYICTINLDSMTKAVSFNGVTVRLQIWDTVGQERFRTLTSVHYRGAMGILLLYDVTSRRSFESIRGWLQHIEEHAPPDAVRILVGNKKDLNNQREVQENQGISMAAAYGIPFFESSVKTGENVEESFLHLAKLIHEQLLQKEKQIGLGQPDPIPNDGEGGTIKLDSEKKESTEYCPC